MVKGKKTDFAEANCGIARSLKIIGDWWSILIVRDAFKGNARFGEFQKSLGLAKNILSTRLKKLVAEGILTVEQDEESPSVNRYVLTQKGQNLYVVLSALWQWGEENCFDGDELKWSLVDKKKGEAVPKLNLVARDGRVLGPRDFCIAMKNETES
jgi:DNA-binding HxlR family transcriptional regulator